MHALDGFNECPELFELPVDGHASNTRWVLHDARFLYWVGSCDDKVFTPGAGPLQGDTLILFTFTFQVD